MLTQKNVSKPLAQSQENKIKGNKVLINVKLEINKLKNEGTNRKI